MKVVGALSWFDEPDQWLRNLPVTLKGVCTHLVALDGRYSRFPSEHDESPSGNYEALRAGCDAAGLELTLVNGGVYQGDEIEKRNHLFELVEEQTTTSDWMFVIDGDTFVQHAPKRRHLHTLLSETDRLSGTCRLMDGTQVQAEDLRMFHRCLRGIRCDGNHYTYRAGDGTLLWGDPAHADEIVPAVATGVVCQHWNRKRPADRTAQAKEYYNRRHLDRTEYGQCQFCHSADAVLKVPTEWYIVGDEARAKWFEACERCAVSCGDSVRGELAALGASPEVAELVLQQLYA